MAGSKWQRIRIDLPKGYKPVERIAIASEIIDYISSRTKDGVDKNGKPFPKYSGVYSRSIEFKNAGKSKSSVDLRLTGEMMNGLKLLSEKPGSVTIGFDNGTPENDKADGNIRGTYGNPSPLPGKKRDFLGVRASELREILAKYPQQDRDESLERAQKVVAVQKAAKKALKAEDEED